MLEKKSSKFILSVLVIIALAGIGFLFHTPAHRTIKVASTSIASTSPTPTPSTVQSDVATPSPKPTPTPSPTTVVTHKAVAKSVVTPMAHAPRPKPSSSDTRPKIIPYVVGNVLKEAENEGIHGNGWVAGIDIEPGIFYTRDLCSITVAGKNMNEYQIQNLDGNLAQVRLTSGMQLASSCDLIMGTPAFTTGNISGGIYLVGQNIPPGNYVSDTTCTFFMGSVDDLFSGAWFPGSNEIWHNYPKNTIIKIDESHPGVFFHEPCSNLHRV
jgi:hypothetical protein